MSAVDASLERVAATILRPSSYNIYVDLPDDPNTVVLVHGYAGAYDRISRNVAAYLRSIESKSPPKPLYGEWTPEETRHGSVAAPSAETIDLLRKRGYLTAMTVDEEEQFFTRLATKMHAQVTSSMPAYLFMPTYDCNLRCAYCFQDHMRRDSRFAHLLGTMSRETADRIIGAMPQIERRHGIAPDSMEPRYVTFFGGEPLLGRSRSIVEYIIDRVLEKGPARFEAVTNATELDQYESLLRPDRIAKLQVTLDGPPEAHDKRRIYADGSGSFEQIARNITMSLERDVYVEVRMNVDRNNLEALAELAETFHARLWAADRRFSAYAAPISDTDYSKPGRRANLLNSWELDEALREMQRKNSRLSVIQGTSDGIRARARKIFGNTLDSRSGMTTTFCGAHTKMYIFDSFADIYACWERTGDKNVRIGWLDDANVVNFVEERRADWRSRTVVSNPVCRKCRFALSCGGGCAVLAEGASGTLHSNYCDGFGKRFRARVAEAFLEHEAAVTSGM